MNAERQRLELQRQGKQDWRLWGPYLSERAWGTVREDYSADGTAWEYFDHDQARSRAYRWNEDGLAGLCDRGQRLCFALAFWNEKDPFLKERAFGVTGNQGNHGEDVKEYFFYVDATPSHSYLRYRYKYPQDEYPYAWLVEENHKRSRREPPFQLMDTGVFHDNRYWDIEVYYAKASVDEIHVHVLIKNLGPDAATLHVLPTLWFRNTWDWDDHQTQRPVLRAVPPGGNAAWAVRSEHPELGHYYLYGRQPADPLFTHNESNKQVLWQVPNEQPYVKDAFHRRLIHGETGAVNPDHHGTKFAAWHRLKVQSGQKYRLDMVLSAKAQTSPFRLSEVVFSKRRSEADVFYDELLPEAGTQDYRILRQALSGMIWCKQFYHYGVSRWLDGDQLTPPDQRLGGRNKYWRHFHAEDVISMPDKWEYPWFAAWDTAYHCCALALVDVDFAKEQMELMLKEHYLHPNGQLPAYEWAFGDVNPPVHAMGVLKVFRAERIQRGRADRGFLKRVFHKLLLNYAWWINRKDSEGHNVFEGGFLGMDNISVLDRSKPLPSGYRLKQADATGWMAKFALNMTVMALELAVEDGDYEDIAIQTYQQFLAMANTIAGYTDNKVSLWDDETGFFKDIVCEPGGDCHRIDIYSWVGLIPLFACEVIDHRLLKNVPRFKQLLHEHKGGLFQGNYICACPDWENERGEHLLALADHTMLPRILKRLLNEQEFLSAYGVRSVSRIHAEHRELGYIPGIGEAIIDYVPGESETPMFGGNSNWRGPIWLPTNYSLIQALERFYRFLGDGFTVEVPCLDNKKLNLQEIANLIADRLVNLYRRDDQGRVAAYPDDSPFQSDPRWKDLCLFYEYFHGDTGRGLGAAHQTGWTGLLANLVMRRYRKDIPSYWRQVLDQ